MANFNTLIKRKQYIWLGLILAGGAAAVGGGLYLSDLNMSSDEEAPAQGEPAPDMTGVVDSSFTCGSTASSISAASARDFESDSAASLSWDSASSSCRRASSSRTRAR